MDLSQLILGYLIPFKKDESFTHTMKLCKSLSVHESYSTSLSFKLKLEQRVKWSWVKICKDNDAFTRRAATNTVQIFRGVSGGAMGHKYDTSGLQGPGATLQITLMTSLHTIKLSAAYSSNHASVTSPHWFRLNSSTTVQWIGMKRHSCSPEDES